ncbi:MAG TPA: flagellar FlbD family protein [Microbacteriaceae bacterium]|nr:flagellar FlbD family protein [Microbacteriaceae bacterium]
MILVTRLNGGRLAVNPDLIERITASPDSTITMVDGVCYVVRESLETVIDRIVDYRARVLAVASSKDGGGDSLLTMIGGE